MCKSEWLDRNERKFCKPYEELLEESNSKKIHKALKGQLSYTTEEWLRARRNEK